LDNLNKTELSYDKFTGILLNIDNSVKQILNDVLINLYSFDENEYEEMLKSLVPSSKSYQERKAIFDEYFNYINTSINFLDSILIKLDKLQLETTKIKTLNVTNIESFDSIKDINTLITTIKLYKI
jgi:hypothetical protein